MSTCHVFVQDFTEHSTLQYAVQTIWKSVRDLLQPQQPPDVRQAVLHFTRSLVVGQYSELGMMRAQFFKVIQTHRIEEDAQQRSVLCQERCVLK